jgi:glycine/D-amino acid oxidase-like deaminating enzyme
MKWDREADIVVIGSGLTGLPAAIVAREKDCSVILVEAEKDIGGRAITRILRPRWHALVRPGCQRRARAMAIGASLWDFYNQIGEFGSNLTKLGSIGYQYNYWHLQWMLSSPVFDRARATGLRVADWQDVFWSTCSASVSTARQAGNASPTTTIRSIPMSRETISTPKTSNRTQIIS